MSAASKPLTITLQGREFKVACPEGEEGPLRTAVELLNRRMQELRASGRVVGNERIALLAALHVTHELLMQKTPKGFDMQDVRRRIESMQAAIDDALAEQDKLF